MKPYQFPPECTGWITYVYDADGRARPTPAPWRPNDWKPS